MNAETAEAPTTRFRLDIAYDGTNFHGWARQPGQRTVQGVLEDGLGAILHPHRVRPSLVVAGRTDAGVHAAGQVAHLDVAQPQLDALIAHANRPRHPRRPAAPATAPDVLLRRLNGVLSRDQDVSVQSITQAPAGFDARFSAVWRRYEYRIADTPEAHDPLQRHRTTWHPVRLDLDAMDAAAGTLVGLHDFAAYCKPRAGATTIRSLQQFRWRRDDDQVLVADVAADAFCHSMVRALVGACVAVGAGVLQPSDLAALRDQRERTSAFKVMAARGLTLMEVGYPPDAELARRAEQTRARRAHSDIAVVR